MPTCIPKLNHDEPSHNQNESMDYSCQRKKKISWISFSSHRVLYTFNKTFMEYFLLSPENVFLLNYFLGLASTVYAPNGPLENLLFN
jgi:hypothetical protein